MLAINRAVYLLSIALSLASCLESDPLHEIRCGNSCAIDQENNLLVGLDAEYYSGQIYNCGVGTLNCTIDNVETCDGWRVEKNCSQQITQNCDGWPVGATLNAQHEHNDCSATTLGVCADTTKVCYSDGWHCLTPSTYGDEFCDGLDNDCNGEVDEKSSIIYIGSPFKYSYPLETANVGTCRAGVIQCVDGEESYIGEVGPRDELCGTMLDEDCDGLTDESELDLNAAFYLSVDFSASMSFQIEALISAICQWSSDPQFTRSKFAIDAVAIDSRDIGYRQQITDFVDAVTACDSLTNFYNSGLHTVGSEFIAYSMIQSMRSEYHWPSDLDRKMVMFTDEPYQSDPRNIITDESVFTDMCESNPDIEIGFFINAFHRGSWQSMINNCGVWVEELGYDAEAMLRSLNDRFRGIC